MPGPTGLVSTSRNGFVLDSNGLRGCSVTSARHVRAAAAVIRPDPRSIRERPRPWSSHTRRERGKGTRQRLHCRSTAACYSRAGVETCLRRGRTGSLRAERFRGPPTRVRRSRTSLPLRPDAESWASVVGAARPWCPASRRFTDEFVSDSVPRAATKRVKDDDVLLALRSELRELELR